MSVLTSVFRTALFGALAGSWLLADAGAGAAQVAPELPMRAVALAHPLAECPALDVTEGSEPAPEAVAEAESLLSAASEAALLGDVTGVRDLLARATALDPRSQEVAYRLARAHEELGETEDAIRWYCRALGLMGEGDDSGDVSSRLDRLQEPLGPAISEEALRAFEEGVDLMASGAVEEAAIMFSSALSADSALADAYYNRGLAYGVLRRPDAAVSDFQSYLLRRPEARDQQEVRAAIGFLEEPPVSYGASTAFALGLALPGAGHFYTGRPLGGALLLALGSGAAAAGFLYEEVKVVCLSVPRNGVCPEADVVSRETTRPLLAPALGLFGASAFVGAISAYRGARARNDAAGRLRIAGSAGIALAGVRLLPPRVIPALDGVALEALRLRF